MAISARHKNAVWTLPEGTVSVEQASLAILMDIRDELQAQNAKLAALLALANCYRIPRALDACVELAADARRRKRTAAKRRKALRA